jgi:hypothetical protein
VSLAGHNAQQVHVALNHARRQIMNAQHALPNLFHRPVRLRVRYPDAEKQVVSFIEDEEEFDGYEQEVKRMIQLQGMVSPQFDAVALEAWD